METHQDGDTTCIICMEPVEDRTSYSTMVCPFCKHAWFHRGCIQVRRPFPHLPLQAVWAPQATFEDPQGGGCRDCGDSP